MDLNKLKEPFTANDIEWRLQKCGSGENGIWGMCLAYVTNRAIQNRLDEICGPENWKNDFREAPSGGVMCGISIRCGGTSGDEWVTKWDGAENTDIEAVKGGLSNAMKRAAVEWGIGRYLYNLDASWAKINEKGRLAGKLKDGTFFRWDPPELPEWALPKSEMKRHQPTPVNQTSLQTVSQVVPQNNNTQDVEFESLKRKVLDFITKGVLSGVFADRASEHIQNKNTSGLKAVIEYCNQQQGLVD